MKREYLIWKTTLFRKKRALQWNNREVQRWFRYIIWYKMITTPLYRIYNNVTKQYVSDKLFVSISWYVASNFYDIEEQEEYIIERCTWMQEINWNRMYEWDIVTSWLDYKDIKYTIVYEWMQWKISNWANLKFVTDWKDLEVVWNIHS